MSATGLGLGARDERGLTRLRGGLGLDGLDERGGTYLWGGLAGATGRFRAVVLVERTVALGGVRADGAGVAGVAAADHDSEAEPRGCAACRVADLHGPSFLVTRVGESGRRRRHAPGFREASNLHAGMSGAHRGSGGDGWGQGGARVPGARVATAEAAHRQRMRRRWTR